MSRRRNVIRVGDQVKVVTPEFVLRWGYPMSVTEEMQKILDGELPLLEAMLKLAQPPEQQGKGRGVFFDHLRLDFKPYHKCSLHMQRVYRHLAQGVALERCQRLGYGGGNRQLFTKVFESHAGEIMQVIAKKVVKTGSYFPSSGGYNEWCGDWDYCEGGLSDMQTHVLLEVVLTYQTVGCGRRPIDHGEHPRYIELKNVEKMEAV